MIKCPNCGSTAQVKKNIPHTDKAGNYIYNDYVCGGGCYLDEPRGEYNFLFEDEESGERFFVQCADETKCEAILLENGFDLDSVYQIGVYDDEDAEALGYDTY